MQTINFNTKALWKRCYNSGSSMSAYTEGIPDSAWGEHWAAGLAHQSLVNEDREAAYTSSFGRPGEPCDVAAPWATQALLNDHPSASDCLVGCEQRRKTFMLLWLLFVAWGFYHHHHQSYTQSVQNTPGSLPLFSLPLKIRPGVIAYKDDIQWQVAFIEWVACSQCWVMVLPHLWLWTLYQSHF